MLEALRHGSAAVGRAAGEVIVAVGAAGPWACETIDSMASRISWMRSMASATLVSGSGSGSGSGSLTGGGGLVTVPPPPVWPPSLSPELPSPDPSPAMAGPSSSGVKTSAAWAEKRVQKKRNDSINNKCMAQISERSDLVL